MPAGGFGFSRQLPNLLRLAAEGGYPPFSALGPDGKLRGFDIDIGMVLCERMQLRCVQVEVEFDAMIPALRAKKDPAYFGIGAGIALRKGDKALQAALNAALAAIRADGTYKKINDRYFSFDIYGAEPAKR